MPRRSSARWRVLELPQERHRLERGARIIERRLVRHVYPLNDLRSHQANAGLTCWCSPTVEAIDLHDGVDDEPVFLVVHQAADGRELVERYGLM